MRIASAPIKRPWRRRYPASPQTTASPLDPTLDLHLLDSLRVCAAGIGLFDPTGRLRHANPVFLEAFETRLEDQPSWEAMLRACHETRRGMRIVTDDIESWLASERRSHRQAPTRAFAAALCDGRQVWISESLQTDGWLLMVVNDVTALHDVRVDGARAGSAAPIAPQLDVLTGLPNRRQILQRLDAQLASTRQLRVPFCVAVLEIDPLPTSARDDPEAADRVLEHFAGLVRRHLRPRDEAGRLGDHDFLLLLPNTTVRGADEALARLRAQLHEVMAGDGVAGNSADVCAYDFSAGVAPALVTDTATELFTRADGALYLAKDRGRGCQELVTYQQLGATPPELAIVGGRAA